MYCDDCGKKITNGGCDDCAALMAKGYDLNGPAIVYGNSPVTYVCCVGGCGNISTFPGVCGDCWEASLTLKTTATFDTDAKTVTLSTGKVYADIITNTDLQCVVEHANIDWANVRICGKYVNYHLRFRKLTVIDSPQK